MSTKVLISRNTGELWLTVFAAFAFVLVYNSSPVIITILALSLTVIFPTILKKPEYGMLFLAVILPFKYLNIKFVSIIGLNRVVIWGLLGYIFVRQLTSSQKLASRSLRIFNKAVLLFIVATVISSIQTVSALYTTSYITFPMVKTAILANALGSIEALLIVYIIYYFIHTWQQIQRLIEIMLCVSLIIAFLGIVQYYTGGPVERLWFLFDMEFKFHGRATSVFSNPNGFGSFLAPMLTMAASYCLWNPVSRLKRILILPVIVLNSWGLFLSFSRGAAIQALFGVAIAGLIYCMEIQQMKLSWKVLLVIISVLGIFFMAIQYYEIYLQARAISSGAENYLAAVYWLNEIQGSSRVHAAIKAIQTFIRHPVLGIGYELFSAKGMAGVEYFGLAVHNQYLKILAEMGLLGFMPFIILLGTVVKTGMRIWDKHRKQSAKKEVQLTMLLLLTGFCTSAFGFLFSDGLFFMPISGYLWIFAGAIFALDRQYNELEHNA